MWLEINTASRHGQRIALNFLSCLLQPCSSTCPLIYSICLSGYLYTRSPQQLCQRSLKDDFKKSANCESAFVAVQWLLYFGYLALIGCCMLIKSLKYITRILFSSPMSQLLPKQVKFNAVPTCREIFTGVGKGTLLVKGCKITAGRNTLQEPIATRLCNRAIWRRLVWSDACPGSEWHPSSNSEKE